jgi:hypothetical protein
MVQPRSTYDPTSSQAAFGYRDLPPGARVTLKSGAVAEVTGNPGDGCWLLVRFVEDPTDPSRAGEEDMIFFTDVEGD